MAWCHRHVAPVEERVQVLAKQDAVRGRMSSARRVRSDVRGFKNMQHRGVREGAPPFVRIRHDEAK